MSTPPPAEPSVRDCITLMRDGHLSAEQLLDQCFNNIKASEDQVQAWTSLDETGALERARMLDDRRRRGFSLGALHGIPIGIKDIVDTVALPTERGTSIYTGRQTDADAAIIERLLEAGAIILGKTVTTELAWMNESGTRNPHNLAHTPGGSSSGSAAAVAAGHVPLAIGTQTGGSVIRPASFNGVFGYKPSFGLLSRRGVLTTSPSLDQIGVFGRDAGDIALLVDVLQGYDPLDNASKPIPRPAMLAGYESDVLLEPALAWIDMPYSDRYSEATVGAFEEVLDVLDNDTGATVDRITAPISFKALLSAHQIIYDVEILRSLNTEWNEHRDQLSETAQQGLTRAETRTEAQYLEALEVKQGADEWFATFFHDYDAIITPSAVGTAPLLGNGTGDPVCCVLWTLCGLPCISLPLLTGDDDLPMGVQLVGSFEHDDRLHRTCRWILEQLDASPDDERLEP